MLQYTPAQRLPQTMHLAQRKPHTAHEHLAQLSIAHNGMQSIARCITHTPEHTQRNNGRSYTFIAASTLQMQMLRSAQQNGLQRVRETIKWRWRLLRVLGHWHTTRGIRTDTTYALHQEERRDRSHVNFIDIHKSPHVHSALDTQHSTHLNQLMCPWHLHRHQCH